MNTSREATDFTSAIEISNSIDQSNRTYEYQGSLHPLHVDPSHLEVPGGRYPAGRIYDRRVQYLDDAKDRVGYVADWIRRTIHEIPGGVELVRDVDDGGETMMQARSTEFTHWVPIPNSQVYSRFAKSRTARHSLGILRTPIQGGVVLEYTKKPESDDPRHAASMVLYEFEREADANYPWVKPRPGRVFDMTSIGPEPFFAGPLFGGHPNEIKNPYDVELTCRLAKAVLGLTVEGYLQNY